jgi:hypothetical protein
MNHDMVSIYPLINTVAFDEMKIKLAQTIRIFRTFAELLTLFATPVVTKLQSLLH